MSAQAAAASDAEQAKQQDVEASVEGGSDWWPHGVYNRYASGCRCVACKAAKSAYARERRADARAALTAAADERAAVARDERALLSAAALREQLHLWDSGYARARRDTLQVALAVVRSSDAETACTTLAYLLEDATAGTPSAGERP